MAYTLKSKHWSLYSTPALLSSLKAADLKWLLKKRLSHAISLPEKDKASQRNIYPPVGQSERQGLPKEYISICRSISQARLKKYHGVKATIVSIGSTLLPFGAIPVLLWVIEPRIVHLGCVCDKSVREWGRSRGQVRLGQGCQLPAESNAAFLLCSCRPADAAARPLHAHRAGSHQTQNKGSLGCRLCQCGFDSLKC